ncbi:MAG TPA: efflux RND transporter periplasmic adaptor subunit [Candidatus Baltobacteraceae bacterium]|nr:efflux RND transporter periplasmic adaptor subunit [Candidatus Baltobacteraceae bacterium]
MPVNGGAKNGRKRRKRWIFLGGGAVALVLVVVAASAALRPNHAIDPDKLAAVDRGDIARSVVATGKIEPLTKVEVKSKASGIVEKLLVDAGDRVKAGQVLAELDKEQLQAAVGEAQANLEAAEAGKQAAEATYQKNIVDAQGPDVPFLKSDMERAQSSYKQGLIALNAMQDAEKNYQLALNRQVSAQRNVLVSKAGVAQADAEIAQSKAALANASENLQYATIVSPIDGEVLSRDVEVGDAVSSILVLGSQATLVMTLGDTSEVYVKGQVDESDIGKVYLGQPARIVVESFKDRAFQGRVTKIAPLGEEKDNVTTFEVRVSIVNATGELRANMSANAEIILEEKKNVLLVPEGAVIFDKDKSSLVEVPDPKADTGRRRVPVKLGISNGVKAEVVSGLSQGEKVVLQ